MRTDLNELSLAELLRQADVAERNSRNDIAEVRVIAIQHGKDVQQALEAKLKRAG